MAELIHIAAAQKLAGKSLDLNLASHLIAGWLKKQIQTVSWEGFRFENGSGLGSYNRISPNQLVAILKFADQKTFLDRSYLSLLPIAGWKGTLSSRLTSPATALRVWAKTGSMSYASSLAGYLFSRSGKKLVFAILSTDEQERSRTDQMKMASSEEDLRKASEWTQAVRETQDQLLEKWIKDF